MASESTTTRTRATLLLRIRDLNDADAWKEFLDLYGPRIFGWCRRYRLQEADATDVTQDVLTRLVKAMRTFDYDPRRGSFRGWLKTVTNNTLRDLAATWSRPDRGSGDSKVAQSLQSIQAPDAMAALASEIEAAAELQRIREAEQRIRDRVKPHTWQAYWSTAVEGRAAADVAQELGIKTADVYVAKSRVIRMLKDEIEILRLE